MRLSFGLSFLSLTSIALAAYNATAEVEQADLQQITKQLPACAVSMLSLLYMTFMLNTVVARYNALLSTYRHRAAP